MKKYLFTFGIGTYWAGKAVVIITDDLEQAYAYMFSKYGKHNVAFSYLWEENGVEIAEKYNYQIIEEIEL